MTDISPDRRTCHRGSAVDLLITLPFIAFFLVQLAHHEMWRDELNVFGIAMASPNLRSLLHHVQYEGHPSLWYLVVWCGTHFMQRTAVLKVIEAFIGAGIYLVIGILSPFTLGEKLLLFCCYFVSFEYTVLSRTYGLCFLVLLIYLRCRTCLPGRVLLNAVLLGLMANTDVLGCFLVAGLSFEYALSLWRNKELHAKSRTPELVAATGTLAILIWFSYWSGRPTPDVSWTTFGHLFSRANIPVHYISAVVNYLVLPYFPVIMDGYPHPFWNPLSLQHPIFFTLMVPAILFGYWHVFRRDRDLFVLIAIVTTGALALAWFVLMGHMRNFGVTFLAFLAGLWIQRFRRPEISRVATVLLSMTAAGGIAAAYAAWNHPFSEAEAAANWLRSHQLAQAELIGVPDTSLASLAELLNRPVYMPECRCYDIFLLFSNRRDSYTRDQFGERVAQGVRQSKAKDIVLVLAYPMTPSRTQQLASAGLSAQPLAEFANAEEVEENYYLFRLSSRPTS